jgi:spore coat protein U-like protein
MLIGACAVLMTPLLGQRAEAQCTIAVTAAVAFGNYDVFAASPTDVMGELRIDCARRETNVGVTLDRGGAATYQPRELANGSERLAYNLYLDASRTQIWGDGTGGTVVFGPGNRNQPRTITVYGRSHGPGRRSRALLRPRGRDRHVLTATSPRRRAPSRRPGSRPPGR